MKPKYSFIKFLAILLIASPLLIATKHSKTSAAISWAEQQLSEMTLEQKIGQFFMIAAYPSKGDVHMNEVEKSIRENGVGSVIWFPVNKDNYLKYAGKLQKASSTIPLFYALDAEWGVSMRMEHERSEEHTSEL